MQIIFAVVLLMSTALGYEFDECAARVEFESTILRITTDYFTRKNITGYSTSGCSEYFKLT
jgi:hypothetical protein